MDQSLAAIPAPVKQSDLEDVRRQQRRRRRRVALLLAALMVGLVVSMALAVRLGRLEVPWSTIAAVILGKAGLLSQPVDHTTAVVVWGIRLSRVVLAAGVGAALAVAGVVFQGLLLNPLADSFTIGVSTGGAFGVALLVLLGVGGTFWGLSPLPLGALAGSLAALAAVLLLAREAGQLRKESLVLAGIVVSTFLSALISLVKSLDEESLSAIVLWIMGSFSGRGWMHVGFLAPYLVVGLCLSLWHSRELDLLALGEEQSHYLGVAVSRVRLVLLLGASCLTAGAVAVSGVIGFVGLVVPHVVRLLLGPAHGRLLVVSALLGALTLIWADVVARHLLPSGQELPVGVVTALIGGPFFFYLLKSRRTKGMW